MSARHAVSLEVLRRDGRALVEVEGRQIAVFRIGDGVYAVDNACPHERNPLIDGEVVGHDLVCAYHRWRFDLATGGCLVGDASARTYRVEVRDGRAWIDVSSSS